jgi:hypothetical protein
VAGLVRREAAGQVLPPRARAQYPEDGVDHLAALPPRPAAAVLAAGQLGQVRLDDRPLLVGQLFASCHAEMLARAFMRLLLVKLIYIFHYSERHFWVMDQY